ncbi:DUF3239 domain-containing protein [Corynebacterium freneyi]|uniref:DUF3239 domain-containing protein n=2 Tax=Corynebacterium freneyi TaxID=134034 RepID=A0A095XXV9_9CORY|nr:DUF3239 domain-containing protein [Corynebacterium freneyi]KGF15050.1 hypothetical protein HMPREF1650_12435 [Corynebacterium freneyi DNF00450]MBP2331761.1 hypothetical protein [Corynebacterium freneyi]MCG7439869.1 DUF3239 domain-containing protein [Corynebacterium freneyi]QXA51798.1 DUF3239 domain-containing protein [Corynebacterium freneyi]WJZ06118.1 hypothetical protein CFREN_10860 [Corynebacterium freneyi]
MSFDFTVDEAHNAANNEYFRDGKRLRLSAAIMAVLLWVGGGLALWMLGASGVGLFLGILSITFGTMCAWVAVTLPGTTGTPQDLYDTWPLAPAMIAEVDPRTMTLMALVDTASEEGAEPRRALVLRTVSKVSGTPRTVGARVPSVAVGGKHRRGRDHWDQITPVPIAWATPSSRIRRDAERSIPEGDWQLLRDNLDRVADVRATKFDLLVL